MSSNMGLLAFLLLFVCGLKSVEGCQCSSGWVGNENSCYLFSSVKKNYNDAKSFCQNQGGGLAIISCAEENSFLKSEARKLNGDQYWLGATDTAAEGTWVWNIGTPMEFKNWGPGEPNNVNGGEDCLTLMKKWSYSWNDEKCSNSFYYVCEILAP